MFRSSTHIKIWPQWDSDRIGHLNALILATFKHGGMCTICTSVYIFTHTHQTNPFQRTKDRAYMYMSGNLWISRSHGSSDYLSVGVSGFSVHQLALVGFLGFHSSHFYVMLRTIVIQYWLPSALHQDIKASLCLPVLLALFYEVGDTILGYRKACGVGSVQDGSGTRLRPILVLPVGVDQTSSFLLDFFNIQISGEPVSCRVQEFWRSVSSIW